MTPHPRVPAAPPAGTAASQPAPRPTSPRRSPWPFLLACAATAAATLVAVLLAAGGAPQPTPAPLPDSGPLTGWALPLARLLAGAASTLATGLLLTASVLLPTEDGGRLPAAGAAACRWAGRAAGVAVVAVAAQIVLTLSDLLAVVPAEALDPYLVGPFVLDTALGRTLVLQALGILVAAGLAVTARTAREAGLALAVVLAAAALPALGGHSAAEENHVLAVVSLAVHLPAVAVWVGGLAGLALLALRRAPELGGAVRRYSPLALGCAIAVALSGVVNASLRIGDLAGLLGSGYGLVLLAKVIAFILLVGFGALHRRRTVPRLSGATAGPDGSGTVGQAFARLAAVELLVMAATFGLAVGLSRTPPPAEQLPPLTGRTPAQALLGYPLPEAPTAGSLIGTWHPDAFGLLFATVAAGSYVAGVRTLCRRGDAWPLPRTAAWLGGVLVVLAVTCTGVGRYAPALFSVHMLQHMALNMVAPLLLVLGAPITLALRALPGRDRRTLLAALGSPPARFVVHPLVTTGIFVMSLYVLYFTPLFEAAMRNHWGHLLMQGHFLASGFLFFGLMLGVDPDPGRPAHLLRVPLLLAVVLAHTVFAVVLVFGATVIGEAYYVQLSPVWAGPLLDDQALGGAIAWVLGELMIVGVLAAIILQWFGAADRADRAAARARERRARAPSM